MAGVPHVFDDSRLTENEVDHEKLQHVLFKILKIFGEAASVDSNTVSDATFFAHPVVLALQYKECELFTELLALGPDVIKDLHVPPRVDAGVRHPATPLHGKWTRKIRTLVA